MTVSFAHRWKNWLPCFIDAADKPVTGIDDNQWHPVTGVDDNQWQPVTGIGDNHWLPVIGIDYNRSLVSMTTSGNQSMVPITTSDNRSLESTGIGDTSEEFLIWSVFSDPCRVCQRWEIKMRKLQKLSITCRWKIWRKKQALFANDCNSAKKQLPFINVLSLGVIDTNDEQKELRILIKEFNFKTAKTQYNQGQKCDTVPLWRLY